MYCRNIRVTNKVLRLAVLFSILLLILNIFMASTAYSLDNAQILDEAKSTIKQYYVDEVSDDTLDSAKSIEDLMKALNDPYSEYYSRQEYEYLADNSNGKLIGIGINIEYLQEGIRVTSVFENSPAYLAGIKPWDLIVEADEHSLVSLPPAVASLYIRGEEGTVAHIKIERQGLYYNFDIIRKTIYVPMVEGSILDNHIGYLKLESFGEDSDLEFSRKLDELEKRNPDSYIIDLRNNLGGYLNDAIDISGHFLGGKPLVNVKDKTNIDSTYYAPTNYKVIDKPVIFLINGYSASASEILTAAVKDYKKAFVIGSKSYGKGKMQSMFTLSDNSVLKLTIYRYFSPLGNAIDNVGIIPDLESNGADEVSIAALLLGGSEPGLDKHGYVKVTLSGREFEIDLNKARLPENWTAFCDIAKSAVSQGTLQIGTEKGWMDYANISDNDISSIFYPGYSILPGLNEVPTDKKFTLNFSYPVDALSIDERDIELIDASSGERVQYAMAIKDPMRVEISPIKPLVRGRMYYLVIHPSISGIDGKCMEHGAIARVTVK